jgi:hypothetical protein
LVIINIVLCGVGFVCFGGLVKAIIVAPHGARYLAPWLARWISPDAAGSVAGSNLYVYAGNNPLKYIDPTGHFPLIPWNRFVQTRVFH